MESIKDTCYKGTRILLGNEKRDLINKMIELLKKEGFIEIQIPIIQYQEIFKSKVGQENTNMMFNFKDRGDRDICLAPEYTAVVQQLAKTVWKYKKEIKIFYVAECFRGEKPQEGRYREFTQLGVEILNPSKDYMTYLQGLALELMGDRACMIDTDATRGLDYYKGGKGFEIVCPELGAQKQVCGGGEYDGGVGFALGIDRLLLTKNL